VKDEIIASVRQRLLEEVSDRGSLRVFRDADWEGMFDKIVEVFYLYTRPKRGSDEPLYFVEIITALGRVIVEEHLDKRNSALASKIGAFVLYSFEELNMVQVVIGAGRSGHQSYVVNVLDDEAIQLLWAAVDGEGITKKPSTTPFSPWTEFIHPSGLRFIKTKSKEIREFATPENLPWHYASLNRSQEIGWRINQKVYEIQLQCFKDREDAFKEIWQAHSPEAKSTKVREARAITSLAEELLGETFYHLYYYDFRGRKYCASAFLNEQGADLAKGLLLRAESKPMTKRGFFWLCNSLAANWAEDAGREDGAKSDKIPLEDRFQWAIANQRDIMAWATAPMQEKGWMKADKPWQFLAACLEFKRLRDYQLVFGTNNFDMPSSLLGFIDGTNNGSQHLSALTLDEVTAPHVNLVPQAMPGDLYMYVAAHLWASLEAFYDRLEPRAIDSANSCIEVITELKERILQTPPRSKLRSSVAQDMNKYRKKYKAMIQRAAPVFWLKITNDKHKRKLVKRGTMTLPYGAKAYGLGEQVIVDSRKHGIDLLLIMEHSWGAYLGRALFDICERCLVRPMRLLETFSAAGQKAEDEGRFLSWVTPVTGFRVIQHYVEGEVKKVWVQYGPPRGERLSSGYYENTYQIKIAFPELPVKAKRKQAQGAAPNIIHSLDAEHLTLVCIACDFDVTTIHDSFGCLLSDMDDLFRIVREQFVVLYERDVLGGILRDIDMEVDFEKGKLRIRDVLKSEFSFF
jgi:DNA-directed RNA polymerase